MQGLEPEFVTETISARMPTPEEKALLDLDGGEPVMLLTRITTTNEDRPIEFARGVHAASRFAWTYTVRMPD